MEYTSQIILILNLVVTFWTFWSFVTCCIENVHHVYGSSLTFSDHVAEKKVKRLIANFIVHRNVSKNKFFRSKLDLSFILFYLVMTVGDSVPSEDDQL